MTAEAPSIGDQTFDFPDRGRTTVRYIDLFDECRHGADRLFFRGRFDTIFDVRAQIEAALDPSYEKFGGGNPVARNAEGGIALNRYHVTEKRHWIPAPDGDPYPNKADYAVQFLLRLRTWEDFLYVTVGVPWTKFRLNPDGSVAEDYPIDPAKVESGFSVADLAPLTWHNCSAKDAALVCAGIGGQGGYVEMSEEDYRVFEYMNKLGPDGERLMFGFMSQETESRDFTDVRTMLTENGSAEEMVELPKDGDA